MTTNPLPKAPPVEIEAYDPELVKGYMSTIDYNSKRAVLVMGALAESNIDFNVSYQARATSRDCSGSVVGVVISVRTEQAVCLGHAYGEVKALMREGAL